MGLRRRFYSAEMKLSEIGRNYAEAPETGSENVAHTRWIVSRRIMLPNKACLKCAGHGPIVRQCRPASAEGGKRDRPRDHSPPNRVHKTFNGSRTRQ